VAVNLAVSLARQGLKVGLLDADIYGPSLPRMLGLNRKPEVRGDKMIPLRAWGLSCMSIGFLVEEDQAMIWRGPMVMGALEQMMGQVEWGALDILVVDMPPGTGDAQLTMAQRVALAGAVVVSTPQDIALIDARRGVRMFEKVSVPVLGVVENMSYYCCPNCGHRADLFGHGGARAEAAKLGVDFLGEVPLLLEIRVAGDAGAPIAAESPDSEAAKAYAALARGAGLGLPFPWPLFVVFLRRSLNGSRFLRCRGADQGRFGQMGNDAGRLRLARRGQRNGMNKIGTRRVT
jgi:ATP-binding protein involved in chromosome partitioning